MAKKKAKKKTATSARKSAPKQLERKLAQVDAQIIDLIEERAELARDAAAAGAPNDIDSDLARLEKLVAQSSGALDSAALRAVLSELFSGCRALAAPPRVAYLGPPYSYSHLATLERFGSSIELTPVGNIAAVFVEVNHGQADYGVVPIENSTDGRVVDTLDMFGRHPVRSLAAYRPQPKSAAGTATFQVHEYACGAIRGGPPVAVGASPATLAEPAEPLRCGPPD